VRVLVTGGAGFIGSHVAEVCLEAGHEVVVIDNLVSGKKRNVPEGARFVETDIRSEETRNLISEFKPEALFHLGAQMSVTKSLVDPAHDASVNILGGLNLLETGRQHGLKRVIFSSTGGAIYGEQEVVPCDESHPKTPVSPYGVTKYAFEKYLEYYRAQFGIDSVCLRYSNVYGPRQNPNGEAGVIAVFARQLLTGESSTIYGDGEQTRDFVYVSDVARANLAGLNAPCGSYNIGTSREITINQLYQELAKQAGRGDDPVREPGKKGETRRSALKADLARETFGWTPEIDFETGIKKTMDWFRSDCEKAND
jgi:UDP-glucose 4-epimerase